MHRHIIRMKAKCGDREAQCSQMVTSELFRSKVPLDYMGERMVGSLKGRLGGDITVIAVESASDSDMRFHRFDKLRLGL